MFEIPLCIERLTPVDIRQALWKTLNKAGWGGLAGACVDLPNLSYKKRSYTPEEIRETPAADIQELYRVAVSAESPGVALAALEKITDDYVLAAIAGNRKAVRDVKLQAVEQIRDETVLVCLGHCCNEWYVAIAAINRIKNQKAIFSIIQTGSVSAVRVLAVRRITDCRLLAAIAKTNTDDQTRDNAAGVVADEQVLAEVALGDCYRAARITAIGKLHATKTLAGIARGEKDRIVRDAARARVVELQEFNRLCAGEYPNSNIARLFGSMMNGERQAESVLALEGFIEVRSGNAQVAKDQETYYHLSLNSRFVPVRKIAAGLVEGAGKLHFLMNCAGDEQVRLIAMKKLGIEALY